MTSREKSGEVLAYEKGISRSTALRILHKYNLTSVKPTRKPGLLKPARKTRLDWRLEHADWTIEDWKRAIWSDETSVILGHRRGAIRVWRSADEAFNPIVIRSRWKGFSSFM